MSELSISDISITVEDGLRLSELQGRLAELQVQIADPGTYAVESYIIAAILMFIPIVVLGVLVFFILDDLTWDIDVPGSIVIIFLGEVGVVVLWIVASILIGDFITHYTVAGWERDVVGIQAQIDAIMSKYEVVS